MHRYRHLMVGLTRTTADVDLIRYAALVARLGTANEVHFVHVLPAASDPIFTDSHDRAIQDMEATVKLHFNDVPESSRLHFHALKGPVLDRLLEFAAEQEIDLTLVGHLRSHPGQKALAKRLAMKAPCSVWIVPEASPSTLRRILVPIDFSEASADCLEVATGLAALTGEAECVALHVYFNEATATYEDYGGVLLGREREAFDRFVAPLNCHGIHVAPLFEEAADVPHAIHRVAEKQNTDLIVMGTRGRSRSAAILLGSVTEQAMVETRIPLLAVKHFGARMGLLQALLDRRFRQRGGPRFD